MYFAVAGKNLKISEFELSLIGKILFKEGNIFFFETDKFEQCKFLAGFVKIGKIVDLDYFIKLDKKLIGSNIYLKPSDKDRFNFKRYKHIPLLKTDLEVKNKGLEVLFFKSLQNKVGLVKFYQNINIYELIDFERPVRSMNIGMMPSKLAHLMINIATSLNYNTTIYDPFSGLGTTLMVANYLGNNIIGSDLNITPTKQNFKWFMKTEFYNLGYKHFFFKYDVTMQIKKKILLNIVDYIVTEGFLGPKVKKYLKLEEAKKYQEIFEKVYILGLNNLLSLEKLKKIVITFPVYRLKDGTLYYMDNIYKNIQKIAKLELIDEIYIRYNQKIGRQIGIIYK